MHLEHKHLIIHQLFEFLSYLVGGYLFRKGLRKNQLTASITLEQKITLLFYLVAGAFIGSKVLATLNYWQALQYQPISQWLQGKTIVGGLLGGLIGIELGKKSQNINLSTGDNFTMPLIIAIGIGRIGCAQAGIEDYTFGNPTNLPWGINLGDGIPRHPTALYEIIFLVMLGIFLNYKRFTTSGMKFKIFMFSYLTFRFFIDFVKPHHGDFPNINGILPATIYLGLSAIQIACLLGMSYYIYLFYKIHKSSI